MRARAWSIPLLLFCLALAVRLAHFTTIPAITDETDELLLALRVFAEGARPLTANEPYLGPLPIYLTAAAYGLLGPSLATGRLVALLLGALVAPATWALGRRMAGEREGLAAGLLAAFAFGPVVLSHVAWGHGAAPALVALALAGLVGALRQPSRGRWLATGLAGGLALAAHPTVLAFLPGAGLWWLHGDRRPAGARLVALAWLALGTLVGYAPNALFVALNGLAPFGERLGEQEYVGTGPAGWLAGIPAWLEGLARNLWGPAQSNPWDPRTWLALAVLGAALWAAARAREWLPLALVASGAVLMPLLVQGEKYASLTGLRYPAPALPVALVAVAIVGVRGGWALGRLRPDWRLATGAVLLLQAVALAAFYGDTRGQGLTGEPVLAVAEGLAAAAETGGTVFVDNALDTKLIGGGEVGRAVRALLLLRGAEHTVAKADKIRYFLANGQGATYDLLLAGDTADALGAEFRLEPLKVVPVLPGQVSRSGDHWGWYRFHGPR